MKERTVRRSTLAFLLFSSLGLNGCLAERIENEERLKDDETSYRQCLLEHTAQPDQCAALKQLYDEDSKNLTTF